MAENRLVNDKKMSVEPESKKKREEINERIVESLKPNETIVILKNPDDNDINLDFLTQLPFYSDLEESNQQGTKNNQMSNLSFPENSEKFYETFDLEASNLAEESDISTTSPQKMKKLNKRKSKIKTEDAIMFWKSKRHCIMCSKMALSLLFSNIGLTLLIVGYVLFGAWIFQAFEYAYEVSVYQKYSRDIADKVNTSRRLILNRHENILQENTFINLYNVLEQKRLENKDNLDKLLTLINVVQLNFSSAENVINYRLDNETMCETMSNESCKFSFSALEDFKNNITEAFQSLKGSLMLLNNFVTNISQQQRTNGSINLTVIDFIRSASITNNILFYKLLILTFDKIIEDVYTATKMGWNHNSTYSEHEDEIGRTLWTFGGSILYCITIITTIGYGHITPKTIQGRIITIIYAIFGIPIMLIYLTHIGSVMANFFRLIYRVSCLKALSKHRNPCGCKKWPNVQDSANSNKSINVDDKDNCDDKAISLTVVNKTDCASYKDSGPVYLRKFLFHIPNPNKLLEAAKKSKSVEVPVTLVITVFFIYNVIGSIFFLIYEGWTFIDSFYFSFITLSTIGFGDLVPIATGADTEQYKSIMCSFYVLFGLSLCVMSFDLMEKKCKSTVKKTLKKIRGIIIKKDKK